MDLTHLLRELRRNKLHDRSDQVSGASDQLWSDCDLVDYISEAEDRFCRETEILRDATTPEVCQVQMVAGQSIYPLHDKVIGVISAQYTGDTADLARTGHSNLQTYQTPATYFFDPNSLSILQPGKPLAFGTDEGFSTTSRGSSGVMNLRIYPVVAAPYTAIVNLRVVRRPLLRFSLTNMEQVPEVPDSFHLDMLDWAAYLAMSGADLDIAGVEQLVRMRQLAAAFDDTCKRVRQQLMRRVFAPAVWAFGRNGFSYERDYN